MVVCSLDALRRAAAIAQISPDRIDQLLQAAESGWHHAGWFTSVAFQRGEVGEALPA